MMHPSPPSLASTMSANSSMISEVELPLPRYKTSLSSQTTTFQPLSLSSLPDEIIEHIFARIPRWAYPNLSLVCKRFLSLISSPQLYKTRFNLGTTEPCLYFCVEPLDNDTSLQWFTLSMKPQETRNGETLNDYSLIPVPSYPHSLRIPSKSTVAVGSDIYVIGGCNHEQSSSVRILDCQSHTWRDGPNMTVARSGASAVYLDGKIYVMNVYWEIEETDNWFEVFDIKTQTWRVLHYKKLPNLSLDHELCRYTAVNPDAFEGKLYAATGKNDYTYEPKDGTWKVVREESSFAEMYLHSCVIDNVMYSFCYFGNIKWFDSEGRVWREIKGLEGLCSRAGQILNYGGKLVVMWVDRPIGYSENVKAKIWCAKIALEKRHKDEIWGKTEWLNTLFETTKSSYYSFPCVAVSI